MTNGFDNLLDSTGKLIETVPDFYDDAVSPAVKESGKTLRLLPAAINAAFAPLRRWIAHQEYSVSETEKILEMKLKNVNPDQIVPPEPYVAIPALQAISYAMDNDTLRNMYANVLANAMNTDNKSSVHPSFVEIIKQLSPLDAKVFKHLCINFPNQPNPIVNLRRYNKKDAGGVTVVRNLTLLNFATIEDISLSIDNLERLKLIEIPIYGSYTNQDLYAPFESLGITQKFKITYEQFEHLELKIEKKTINITDLGSTFYRICVKEN